MADIFVNMDKLTQLAARRMAEAGLDPAQAQCAAEALVHADARGVHSHGTIRAEHYCTRIRKGGINLGASFPFTATAKAAGVLDAQGGMGHYAAMLAMKEAASRVKETGIYAVLVKNSSHCGALSFYIQYALNLGLTAMMMVNTDKIVAPHGAAEPYFGTNPLAFGLPGEKHRFLIDMATSGATFGAVLAAREKGEYIPAHWGVDAQGRPATDPYKIACLAPMAAYKGTAIAAAVEGLTGLFTGAFGPGLVPMYEEASLGTPRNLSAFIFILDPEFFGGRQSYYANTDKMFREIRSLRPALGTDRVLAPGEPEDLRYAEALKKGCPVSEKVWDFLNSR